jgi:hypothetical protein
MSFIGVVWIFVAPFLAFVFMHQEWVPERTTYHASGKACASVGEFYNPMTDPAGPSTCRMLAGGAVVIEEKVLPPDYDKYPAGAAARAKAYSWSQTGGGTTIGDARIKEHAAEEAGRAAYERAQREWGDAPMQPTLLRVTVERSNSQLFIDERDVQRTNEGGYYSPSTLAKWIVVLLATAAGFGGFFLLVAWESNIRKG